MQLHATPNDLVTSYERDEMGDPSRATVIPSET